MEGVEYINIEYQNKYLKTIYILITYIEIQHPSRVIYRPEENRRVN